ncbi:hypothetical protein [Sphingosinicella terrae]|uniref:hypothetical protein n=1 Tax=Sphingosinicella terrae TaxID=2172047 RepID=UPI000E0D9398|nr:hypothetical protein [Sphingosinicella terrae]
MKHALFMLALCGLTLALPAQGRAAARPCAALPGAEELARPTGPDFVLFGEAHGTNELPEAFADLVCTLSSAGLALTVGLEFLPEDQAALDAYLASDGGPAARAALLASPGWADRHGRASEAILAVVDVLRSLRSAGADIAIVAFDHPSAQPGTSAAREEGMARNLLAAQRTRPHARTVALTGLGHAGKSPWTSLGPPFQSMSQYLPRDGTIALAFVRGGGEVWACGPSAGDGPSECRVRPVAPREPIRPRGLTLSRARDGFDGILSAGRPFTASPPARLRPPNSDRRG